MLRLEGLRRFRAARPAKRYALAAALIGAALALVVVVAPWIHRVPSAPLFAAILGVAWLLGFGPAIFATILGIIGLDYVGDRPPYRFQVDTRDVFWMALFSMTVLGTGWLASTVRRLEDERDALLERERQARTDAEAANRAKEEFLAIVSHELRTPLTTVLGWLQIWRQSEGDAERAATAVETIERSTRLQVKLVEDLLDISGAVAGKLEISLRPVELGAIAAQAVDALRPRAAMVGVALVDHAEAGLDMLGDATRLEQVVTNLVGNAIKFTPPAGVVAVEARRQGNRLRLLVRDTGQGIDPAALPYIFEHFRQGETGLRRREGLGLGLAIARHIVERHGGSITAESAGHGHGSTFIVDLPAASTRADRQHAWSAGPT